ncbi:MAG: hypothetical protein H7A45_04695 [Verrucomicrobiales bacterium]|nr:hypothetical protein [Verrucomicrobiales bacterium]MCP5527672.1 hypothetical protein [Verrucomicrobiales bacterium]
MNLKSILSSLGLILLLSACSTPGGSSDMSAIPLDVYRAGDDIPKAYHEIGLLKDDGKEAEQQEIEAKMIKQAKKMGGDAIIFLEPKQSGMETEFWSWGAAKFTYLYQGRVVAYDPVAQ